MITPDQFKEILQRLSTKSRQNAVNWRSEDRQGTEVFFVQISDSVIIQLLNITPESSPDWCGAYLFVNNVLAVNLVAEVNQENYDFLKNLYFDAKRCYYGWDQALREIEEALRSEDKIGLPPPQPDSGDDIPF